MNDCIFDSTATHDDRDGGGNGDNDCDAEKLLWTINEGIGDGDFFFVKTFAIDEGDN